MTLDAQQEDDQALAAEYALGLLTPPEARAFEARLVREPVLRAQYVVWAEDLVRMTDGIDPVAPPPLARAALEKRLFGSEKTGILAWLGLVPALIGGLVAAMLVYFVTSFGLLTTPASPTHTAEIAAEDQSLIVLAAFFAEDGSLQLERTAGAAVPGRVLELWLIAGDNPPVSLGVLPEDETVHLTLSAEMQAAMAGGTLAISEEPVGGSLNGAPTLVRAVGAVVES